MLVSICIANYKRPEGLKRLVTALHQLHFEAIEAPTIEIIVVENDPDALTRKFCEEMNETSIFSIRHIVEPQPGLSYVRNTAIESISEQSDFLVFIDDDEVPEAQWLESLLTTQKASAADVVTGPVRHVFHEAMPRWLQSANIFPESNCPSGTELSIAFTCNVMIRAAIVRDSANRFDRRFALSGGEDTHFFMRIHRQGHRIIWCNEALIHEYMPRERMNFRWFWMRNYRNYSSYVFCEREFERWYKVFPLRITTGTVRIIIGLLYLLISSPVALFNQRHVANAMFQVARGLGVWAGLVGIQYQEYARASSC